MRYETKTMKEYLTFQTAYDFFNAELWGCKLPEVLITLQRKKGARGYFSPDRFTGRGFKGTTDELALNPDTFVGRSDTQILSTLVHEMAHVWQQHFGKTSRSNYHNAQWGTEMKRVGLYPSNTESEGGKETGQKVSHYIIPGGLFEQSVAKLLETGLKLNWESPTGAKIERKTKPDSKVKYTYPNCGQNSWAKPGAQLVCGVCYLEDGQHFEMESA